MPFVDDLLAQAATLVPTDAPGRPKQADLRRAVSTAYYAVFHETVDQAVSTILLGEKSAGAIRERLQRIVTHSAIKTASTWITGAAKPKALDSICKLIERESDSDLESTCSTIIDLQDARHRADYNRSENFDKQEVLRLISDARDAVDRLRAIQSSDARRLFLLGCILGDQLTRNSS